MNITQPEVLEQFHSLEQFSQYVEKTLVHLYKLLHDYQIANFTLTPDQKELTLHDQLIRLRLIKEQIDSNLSVMN